MRKEYEGAKVTKVDDPEKRGRIKVKCAAIADGGREGSGCSDCSDCSELPFWFEPKPVMSGKNGFFMVPAVGDYVNIELEVSEDDGTILDAPNPKWVCGDLGEGKLPEVVLDKYLENKKNVNIPIALYSKSGHILYFEDTEDSEKIVVKSGSGRLSVEFDQYEETIRITAPRIILDGTEIWFGDPLDETSRIVSKIGRRFF